MFAASTYQAMAAQLARLVGSPSERSTRKSRSPREPSSDGCGCCPLCSEFVFVEFLAEDQPTLCPRCQQPIDDLDPLGS